MATEAKKPLKLFYCYTRVDKLLRDELDIHLSSLKRQQLIISWYDGEIGPGCEWEEEINTQLRNANIILLLVTPNFIASDYCYSIEMERALERHKEGTARVIPIILRRTYWDETPFSSLQALPTDAKPVTQWQDRDEAFWDITINIRKTIKELSVLLDSAKQEWLDKGITLRRLKHYEDALVAFDHAIHLDPTYTLAYHNKGYVLNELKRYEDALIVLDQAIHLDINFALAYHNKGFALENLGRHQEAHIFYKKARKLGL